MPEAFIKRHPFPGPGLAVRILGDVTSDDKLETLRNVDEIFIDCIKEFGLYDKIWQVCTPCAPLFDHLPVFFILGCCVGFVNECLRWCLSASLF